MGMTIILEKFWEIIPKAMIIGGSRGRISLGNLVL